MVSQAWPKISWFQCCKSEARWSITVMRALAGRDCLLPCSQETVKGQKKKIWRKIHSLRAAARACFLQLDPTDNSQSSLELNRLIPWWDQCFRDPVIFNFPSLNIPASKTKPSVTSFWRILYIQTIPSAFGPQRLMASHNAKCIHPISKGPQRCNSSSLAPKSKAS